jgi:hypothetical protein
LRERLDTDLTSGTGNLVAQWSDTDGVISTGAKTYSGISSSGINSAVMWAAILRPAGGVVIEDTSQFFPFL